MAKPRIGPASFFVVAGAILIAASLPMVWYHADRAAHASLTGWGIFTNLRIWLVVAAVLALASLALPRGRTAVIVRAALGLLAGGPVLRRIVSPPSADVALHDRVGLYVALVGSVAMLAGAVLSAAARAAEELGWEIPGMPAPNRPQLPGGSAATAVQAEPIVDAEVVEER
jgi:hypothetical protein